MLRSRPGCSRPVRNSGDTRHRAVATVCPSSTSRVWLNSGPPATFHCSEHGRVRPPQPRRSRRNSGRRRRDRVDFQRARRRRARAVSIWLRHCSGANNKLPLPRGEPPLVLVQVARSLERRAPCSGRNAGPPPICSGRVPVIIVLICHRLAAHREGRQRQDHRGARRVVTRPHTHHPPAPRHPIGIVFGSMSRQSAISLWKSSFFVICPRWPGHGDARSPWKCHSHRARCGRRQRVLRQVARRHLRDDVRDVRRVLDLGDAPTVKPGWKIFRPRWSAGRACEPPHVLQA